MSELNLQVLEAALERLRFDLRGEAAGELPWPQIALALRDAHEELVREGHVAHELDVEQLIIAASFMAAGQGPGGELARQVLLYWINHARYRAEMER
jgi:hypothetical protein